MLNPLPTLALAILATLATAQPYQGPGSAYCYGVSCPCGNDDPAGGCINSSGSGARLEVFGSDSVLQDDAIFSATQLSANSVCLLVVGSQTAQEPFSNGQRCVGGFIQRVDQHLNSGQKGAVAFSNVLERLAVTGLAIQPGETWNFQVWYRDTPASQTPCQQSSNMTNAYAITFVP